MNEKEFIGQRRSMMLFKDERFGGVRTLMINDEPWFIGRDVAEILGYGSRNNRSKALTNALKDHVDDEDKRLIPYRELKELQNGDLKNISHYGAVIINESGVVSLICSSKLPSAKQFKHWITSEVMPSIRKHGAYVTDDVLKNILKSPELGIRLMMELKDRQEGKIKR